MRGLAACRQLVMRWNVITPREPKDARQGWHFRVLGYYVEGAGRTNANGAKEKPAPERFAMSTLTYAALTQRREEAEPGTSKSSSAPGLGVWADSLASLVPAEVLAIHAAVIGAMTKTTAAAGGPVTTITNVPVLRNVFYALVILSALLYVGARIARRTWDGLDWLRMLIPPLAFVGWTMLQCATAFDAAFQAASAEARTSIAVIGAVILGFIASLLAYRADQKQPQSS